MFNEMKGVYSSPDSMNQRHTQQAMFPDNTYAVDSGGDPVDIPNLSFDECAPAVNIVLDGLELAAVCEPAVQPVHKGMLKIGFAGRQPSRIMQCVSNPCAGSKRSMSGTTTRPTRASGSTATTRRRSGCACCPPTWTSLRRSPWTLQSARSRCSRYGGTAAHTLASGSDPISLSFQYSIRSAQTLPVTLHPLFKQAPNTM